MFLKSPPEYRENNVFNKVDKDIEETFTKFFEKN